MTMILQDGKRYIARNGRKAGKVMFIPELGLYTAFVDITDWHPDGSCVCGNWPCEHDLVSEDVQQ